MSAILFFHHGEKFGEKLAMFVSTQKEQMALKQRFTLATDKC